MANTEDIEAKLCAYIDGELDAAGRAEIEKHLETNPRHRQLIEELTRSRNLLRDLPVESAPPDISEALHSQLERSVLLGDLDEPKESVVLRISRWPQFAAVAAIVLLAVGLGAVVYFVLPPSPKTPEYAITEPALPEGDALTTLPTLDEPKMLSEERDLPTFTRDAKVAEAEKLAPAMAPPATPDNAFAPTPPTEMAIARADKAGAALDQHGPLFKSDDLQKSFGNKPLLVVVKTNDSRQTDQDVTSYLTSNNLSWQNATEPMPQPLNVGESQVVSASRLNQTRVQMKQQAEPLTQKAEQAPERAEDDDVERRLRLASPQDGDALQLDVSQKQATPGHAQAGDAAPTTMPVQMASEPEQAVTQNQQFGVQVQRGNVFAPDAQTQQLVQSQLDNLKSAEPAGNYTIDNTYVVRNLTREEAEKLSQTLSQQRLGQRALIVEEPQTELKESSTQSLVLDATTQPTTQPAQNIDTAQGMDAADQPVIAEATLMSGDVLKCQIEGLQGAAAREQTVQIGEDGTAFLPVVGNIRAAGLTADQLQSVIANEYARALLINQPTVKIERVDAAEQRQEAGTPATQPAEQHQVAQQEQSAETAIQQAAEPPAAGFGRVPADERVDVVIVVQNEIPLLTETNSSTTQPATQPSTQPVSEPTPMTTQSSAPQ